MRKINIGLIGLVVLLAHSCIFGDCIRVPLNKPYLDWYKNLPNEGDTLLYKGSDNSIDTFVITNKYFGYGQCNHLEFGDYQYELFRLDAQMINRKVRNNFTNTFSIEFAKKDNSAVETYQYIKLLDLYIEGINDVDEALAADSIHKQKDTLFVGDGTLNIDQYSSTNPISIEEFYWSKKSGLVRYTTNVGIVYEFWKKL